MQKKAVPRATTSAVRWDMHMVAPKNSCLKDRIAEEFDGLSWFDHKTKATRTGAEMPANPRRYWTTLIQGPTPTQLRLRRSSLGIKTVQLRKCASYHSIFKMCNRQTGVRDLSSPTKVSVISALTVRMFV